MNSKIDKMIRKRFQEDKYIPNTTRGVINDILEQNRNIVIKIKPNKPNVLKKFATVMASIIVVFIGSISVYAAFGGTISGMPVLEWMGIKFSDQYEDYKVNVEGQEVAYNETKIDLVSTICDEGYTILEFDVKLSKEDKEYLKLGEKLITEQELEEAKIRDEVNKDKVIMGYKAGEEPYNFLVRYKDLINTIRIRFNENYNEIGKPRCNIIIDGQKYYAISTQSVTKVSEYEYKLYQLYFLTNQELKGKTDFTISLTTNTLENIADVASYYKENPDAGSALANRADNARKIELNGEFNVKVSKNKALENTKVINPDSGKSTYKHMTKEIEEIKITPLQIIAKVTTHIENVSLQSLSSTMNKNYIGTTNFNVYDNLGNKLVSNKFEVKRTITYANGKVEEWSPGDIGTYKSFYNAQMDLVEYIVIEKNDADAIKITPTVREMVYSEDGDHNYKEIEMDALEVALPN